VAPQLAAACSDEFTLDELNKIGERIWNLEREFNLRAGFTAKDDTLPKRLLTEPAKTGPAKGLVNGPAQDSCPSTTRREAGTATDGPPRRRRRGWGCSAHNRYTGTDGLIRAAILERFPRNAWQA